MVSKTHIPPGGDNVSRRAVTLRPPTVRLSSAYALASLRPDRAVKEPHAVAAIKISDRICRVDGRRYAGQVAGPERSIGGIRPQYGRWTTRSPRRSIVRA